MEFLSGCDRLRGLQQWVNPTNEDFTNILTTNTAPHYVPRSFPTQLYDLAPPLIYGF
jgi:hypothetical protein